MEKLDFLPSFDFLPASEIAKLSAISEEIALPKSTIFIEADKTSRYLYILISGLCRIFYHKEDKEVTLGFCFPNEALFSLNSYVYGKSGYENIETLQESTLLRIPVEKLALLYEQSIAIANWGRKLAEVEIIKIEERLMQKLFKSAAEKYRDLLAKEPNLINQIKLGYIASYLGVSQVTLSRIRADIR